MGKELTYFDMAENDYNYLKFDYEHKRIGNVFCYASQNICERYLKHIIDRYVTDIDTSVILRTHNLRVLRNFIQTNIKDFAADWREILRADGYYFSTRYPGSDALIAKQQDIEDAWAGVLATRTAVVEYCKTHEFIQDATEYITELRNRLECLPTIA